jgi:hypothetical protein
VLWDQSPLNRQEGANLDFVVVVVGITYWSDVDVSPDSYEQ